MTANSMTLHDIELYVSAAINLDNVGPALDIIKKEIKDEIINSPFTFGIDYDRLEKLTLLYKAIMLLCTGEAKPKILRGVKKCIENGVKYDALNKIMKLHEAIMIANS